ncbi:MAG: tRNA uridine-5-carboxymethylaminomethyl(34) synthesis GTPase MnmE [Pseudomonadota bacterium]
MNSIFAQCTAPGKAGVAVFRLSGPESLMALEQLIDKKMDNLDPRKLYFRKIYNPKTKEQIDEAMIVYFLGESSFTGETSVEIHTHGSLAVIKQMNQTLSSIDGLRLAEPGEFAKRSFINGKMDLTAAEGLADLIDAETELQHKQAIRQLGGGLERIYDAWRQELLSLISLLEAYIDFPDEDIPDATLKQVATKIDNLITEIKNHLNDNNRGERLRDGLKLAIIGKPNVGKSSLLNFLMKREVAIVSDIAGTTRDVLEGHLDIGGYPIILQDTAGIHNETKDIIEQKGIEKAKQVFQNSDIKIIIYDATETTNKNDDFVDLVDDNTIVLLNKIDLSKSKIANNLGPRKTLAISVKQNLGLDKLVDRIIEIAENIAKPSDTPQITRARHRAQLEQAIVYLTNFSLDDDLVLVTEDIRMTIRSLSNITGKVSVDEILGEIFSNFCIGK